MGGGYPKFKLIETIKSTIGYDNENYEREYKEWPNDNPFTTTSFAPLTTDAYKPMTPTQTAMLQVFQYLHTTTVKPVVNAISTWFPSSSSVSFVTDKDEWGNNVESYRVDEPPHLPGWSPESRKVFTFFFSPLHFLFAVQLAIWIDFISFCPGV